MKQNLKKQFAALLLALCFAVCSAVPALATSASISLERKGSVKITLYDSQNDTPLRGGEITLYKVADVVRTNGNLSFAYTGDFKGCSVDLGDLTDSSLPAKLEKYLPAAAKGTTRSVSETGEVTFKNLSLGLYLVVQTEASKGYEAVNSFVVSLPYKEGSSWVYDVDASPKVGAYIPTVPDEPDEPDTPPTPPVPVVPVTPPDTPEEPEVPDIPVNPGTPDAPVSPGTPDNPVAPGTPDNPVAPGTPDNPVLPGTPDNPVLPQSGQLNWPVPVLACSGLLLFAIGWVLTRKETSL